MSDQGTYTPEQMRVACETLGWSIGEVARRLDIRPDSVRQMAAGKRNIPDRLGAWLDACAAIAATMPAKPEGWQA